MAQDTAELLITCGCGQKMKLQAAAMGKTVTCVKCGEHVKISAESAPSLNSAPDTTDPATMGALGYLPHE